VLAAILALASSISWGTADFLGGLQSRRHALLAVLGLSQGLALAILVVAVLAGAPTEHDTAATLWAAGVGGLGLLGLVAFYRALSIGTMSVVAPISATGVAIPVLVGLASGERPGSLQVAGIVLACCGVGFSAPAEPSTPAPARRADVVLLLAACAVFRPKLPSEPIALGAIAAVGVLDLLANLLFVLAASRGLLSVVGVLGSLYPAVTVVLARFVLHERLTRMQNTGVLITLAGVVALAAG
jgi:drug/metabolite transporter (DMT)-like permease